MMKKVIALLIVVFSAVALGACHYQYHNDGSDYAAPGFKAGQTGGVSRAPKSLDDLSDFERDFIRNIFGENYGFTGYDAMPQSDKDKIAEYFGEYNEGYYTAGFEDGFFYTYNELEGKEIYSIPWGYETLSDKVPEPEFGENTKTSFSEAVGFISEYKGVTSEQLNGYLSKLEEVGFSLDFEEEDRESDPEKKTLNRTYTNAEGYNVNIIFADGVFRLNISAPVVM